MNNQNLVPQSKRTKSEQREIAKKGGRASGKARREAKTLRDTLLLILEEKDSKTGITIQEAGCINILKKFKAGDIKAFEVVRDSIGQKVTEKIHVEGNFTEDLSGKISAILEECKKG